MSESAPMSRFALVLLALLALGGLAGCDQLAKKMSTSSSTPAASAAADAANDTTSEKADLDRRIEDKKAEIERATADLPNLADDQAKIDAANRIEALRQELNDLVDQRGRL